MFLLVFHVDLLIIVLSVLCWCILVCIVFVCAIFAILGWSMQQTRADCVMVSFIVDESNNVTETLNLIEIPHTNNAYLKLVGYCASYSQIYDRFKFKFII